MEEREILVEDDGMTIKIKKEGDFLLIGESPQLVVNLNTQENHIQTSLKRISYKKKVVFSKDFLRENEKKY